MTLWLGRCLAASLGFSVGSPISCDFPAFPTPTTYNPPNFPASVGCFLWPGCVVVACQPDSCLSHFRHFIIFPFHFFAHSSSPLSTATDWSGFGSIFICDFVFSFGRLASLFWWPDLVLQHFLGPALIEMNICCLWSNTLSHQHSTLASTGRPLTSAPSSVCLFGSQISCLSAKTEEERLNLSAACSHQDLKSTGRIKYWIK